MATKEAEDTLDSEDYIGMIQSLKAENSKLKQDNLRLGQTIESMRKYEREEGSSRTTIAWSFQQNSKQSSTATAVQIRYT